MLKATTELISSWQPLQTPCQDVNHTIYSDQRRLNMIKLLHESFVTELWASSQFFC